MWQCTGPRTDLTQLGEILQLGELPSAQLSTRARDDTSTRLVYSRRKSAARSSIGWPVLSSLHCRLHQASAVEHEEIAARGKHSGDGTRIGCTRPGSGLCCEPAHHFRQVAVLRLQVDVQVRLETLADDLI